MCKAELKEYNLIFCFMLSSFLFFNLFSISFLFIALKGSKKMKDKAIKYICFSNIMEILYLLKAFSELQWFFLCLFMFLTHPSSRVTIYFDGTFLSFQTRFTMFIACSDFSLFFFAYSKRCWYIIMFPANIWKLLTVIWRNENFISSE